MACNAIYFVYELRNFNLDLHTVFCRIDTVCSLNCQLAHALHDISGFCQISLCCLDKRHTILNILSCLIQTANLASHFFRHCKTGSIIARSVNAHTARKFFYVFSNSCFDDTCVTLRIHSAHIVVNNHITLLEVLIRHPCRNIRCIKTVRKLVAPFPSVFLHSIISFRNSSSKANNTVIQGFLRVFFKDHGNGISNVSSQ